MHRITILGKGDDAPDGTFVFYCGRGSSLGNPHPMRNQSLAERNRVCDLYAAEFPSERQREACDWLAARAAAQPVALQCFCAPKRCHCETIRDYLIANY